MPHAIIRSIVFQLIFFPIYYCIPYVVYIPKFPTQILHAPNSKLPTPLHLAAHKVDKKPATLDSQQSRFRIVSNKSLQRALPTDIKIIVSCLSRSREYEKKNSIMATVAPRSIIPIVRYASN